MHAWGPDHTIAMEAPDRPLKRGKVVYSTHKGEMLWGDSLNVLAGKRLEKVRGKVNLTFTSPPFPLVQQKKYGNFVGDQYIKWLADFALPLRDLTAPDGSIVIEIGNTWEPGRPVMSTTVMRALLEFLEQGGLHLCQEFIWYNPARLPSPIEWVNKRRIRVKDAFSRIWWMSPSEWPKADNRNVLKQYSKSMEKLLETGKYNAGTRPSEHVVGEKSFANGNGGAIPPSVFGADEMPSLNSLLKASNTRSNDQYQLFMRGLGNPAHPARMPSEIAEFFIKFLTDENDLIVDPFGGSNTTGYQAEDLGRRWISIDQSWDYAAQSIGRFLPQNIKSVGAGIELSQMS